MSPCGSACVDLFADEANFGVCGRVCPTGQSCSGGYCDCPPGQTYCAAANGCVDLSSSTSYCGSCDIACKPTETCSSGQCRCPLGSQVYCPSGDSYVDVYTSTQHCGACDHRCNPTEVCSNGYCMCPSSYNERFCSSQNACVDVYSNNQHCGGCDIACPAGTQCNFGTCTCTQAGFTLCGSTCYDLTNDPRHCGSCTNSCPGNYTCTGSQCKCPDPTVGTAVRLTNNSIDEYVPAVAGRNASVSLMPKTPAASRPTCASHCSIPTALSYLTGRLPPTPPTECRADPVSRGRAPSTPSSGTTRGRASCSNVSTQLEPPRARRSMSLAACIHLKTPRSPGRRGMAATPSPSIRTLSCISAGSAPPRPVWKP